MLRSTYQSGILSILNSASRQPLGLWRAALGPGAASPTGSSTDLEQLRNASYCSTTVDEDIASASVLELLSPSLRATYITCPKVPAETLGIRLPYLILVLKPIDHLFSFEVETSDDRGTVRRFRASNFETEAHVDRDLCRLPLRLGDDGWNYLTLDLPDLTKRAYGTAHRETRRVTIHANIRLRFVFFADRIVPEEQLPDELRLYHTRR
ncbi:transcription factor IIB [Martensiomyces pterosporus]|nr:transcription factor IIB [Martensiomyces pterosporus]